MQPTQDKDFTLDEDVLAVSLELSKGSWKIALPAEAVVGIRISATDWADGGCDMGDAARGARSGFPPARE